LSSDFYVANVVLLKEGGVVVPSSPTHLLVLEVKKWILAKASRAKRVISALEAAEEPNPNAYEKHYSTH